MRRNLRDALLVVASAALYATAFPPLEWSALAWIALVPLLVVTARARGALAAAGFGLLWGILVALGVASWLPGMITRYFEVPPVAAWAAFLALAVGLLGVWGALFGGFVRLAVRRGVAHPAVIAAAFAACELGRASIGIANPWALLATSQARFVALAQSVDLAGPYGLGALIAAVNACVAGAFVSSLRPLRPLRTAGGLALVAGAALAYGSWRLEQPFAEGPERSVALLQDEDPGLARSDEIGAGLDRRLALTSRALASAPTLVVWPELSLGFSLRDGSSAGRRLLEAAAATKADWLVGGTDTQVWATREDRFNSVFLVHGGRVTGRYDKALLMPFAEENPLPGWLSAWRRPFVPGDARYTRPLGTGGLRAGVLLCNEVMYPGYVRSMVAQGAELLINPAYDQWFGSDAAALAQLRGAQLRAIESRRYLLRSTTGGRSAVINPQGRLEAVLDPGASDVLVARVRAARATSPYQRFGDRLPLAGAAFAVLVLSAPAPGRGRAAKET